MLEWIALETETEGKLQKCLLIDTDKKVWMRIWYMSISKFIIVKLESLICFIATGRIPHGFLRERGML